MSYTITGTPEVVNGFISILDPAVRQKRSATSITDEDPLHNFTNTFNACLDHASKNGWNVFVPKGEYVVNYINLCPNTTIKGVGTHSRIRHRGSTTHPYLFQNPRTHPEALPNGSIGGIVIEDLMVTLSGETKAGFMLDRVYESVIARVRVFSGGCKDTAFRFTGGAHNQGTAYYNTLYDVSVNGNNGAGTNLEKAFAFHHSANSNRLQNCRVVATRVGVQVETGYTNHIHVSGCAFENFQYGVELRGSAFSSIIGNRFENTGDNNEDYNWDVAGVLLRTFAGKIPVAGGGEEEKRIISRGNLVAGNFYSAIKNEATKERNIIMEGPENEENLILDNRYLHVPFIRNATIVEIDGSPSKDAVVTGWQSAIELQGQHDIRNAKTIRGTGTIREVDLLTNVDAITGVGSLTDVERLANVTDICDVGTISGVEEISDVGSIQLTRLTAEPVAPGEGTLYHLDTVTHPEGYYLYRDGRFQALVPEPTGPVVPTAPDHPFFQLDARTLFRDGVWEHDLHGWSSLERQVVSDPAGEPVVTFHSIPAWGLLADGMTIDARKLKCLRLRAPKGEAYYRIAVKAYDRDGFQLEDTGATEDYVHLHGAVASETSYWNETQKRRQNRANVYEATLRVLSDEVFFLKVSIFTGVAITTENPITSLVLEVPAATTAEALAAETLAETVFKNPLFDGSLAPQG
ncbi:hypothetical protein EXIGUO8H_210003 [Exiguobacterium sp. 8H]|uniref:hypothetical protein n=1 Tax=unclassified Exiguobacterium TaxID=2644629 RepID=UPI0012EFB664|nr:MULTISPECIES: hypothetical protein [unclassified Exiguobacterium]VXB80875.1 hypothetical protein EXIGUO8H_210003 [Exiguobacterium sp. 8H]VXB91966.1 hypothetical protein EXIGUO8A_210002 [Exiguobacterium sp. 8A]